MPEALKKIIQCLVDHSGKVILPAGTHFSGGCFCREVAIVEMLRGDSI